MSQTDRISTWLRANKWFVAFALVMFAGYSVGKDLALRDNAIDARSVLRDAR